MEHVQSNMPLRKRKVGPSHVAAKDKMMQELAKAIFGVGEQPLSEVGEFRNHEGRGFCWGSAVLAGFSKDLIGKYRATSSTSILAPPKADSLDRTVTSYPNLNYNLNSYLVFPNLTLTITGLFTSCCRCPA